MLAAKTYTRVASVDQNLFDLIGDDLNVLGDHLAERLNNKEALRQAKQFLSAIKVLRGKPVLDQLRPPDPNFKTITLLSLGSDCLRRVSQAILADGEVDVRELEVAYTLVGPLANYFAGALDHYAQFANLEFEQVGEFLDTFNRDSGLFGGGPESETALLGATFATITSILDRDTDALDRYEHITVTILTEIMRIGGLNAEEREVLKSTRDFVRTMRSLVEIHQNQPTGPQEKRKVGASPFAAQDAQPLGLDLSLPDSQPQQDPESALRGAMAELESLIGLPGVKDEVKRLMSFLKIQQERRKHGLRESGQTLHFVFTGNPGTGKTTVARIVSKILCGFGLLKTTKVIECDRSTLVGGYLGQTAIKTDEVVESALDGVLFIDEAYTLSDAFGHDMYGQEAINTLLKRMEDYRERLVVIAAGYPKPMEKFLRTNPGLESRFTRFIRFEDYQVSDLCRIFEKFCKGAEYSLTSHCRAYACLLFTLTYNQRDERFGNARFIRNVFEQAISRHSQRLAGLPADQVTKQSLITLDAPDIPFDAIKDFDVTHVDLQEARWEAECPGCGKASTGGVKYLGQRVTCKCGQKFLFPWWSLVPSSAKALPADLLTAPQVSDKRGEIEKKPDPAPVTPIMPFADTVNGWRADPRQAALLLEEGVRYLKKGQCDSAIKCFETAITIDWPNSDPAKQPYYLCRAKAYELKGEDGPVNSLAEYNEGALARKQGQYQRSIKCYEHAIELDSAFAWAPNNLAWLYATCVEPRYRAGSKAIRYATSACEISTWHCWSFIDTLSAAYAEAGDFDNAVQYAGRAYALAPVENQEEVQHNIARFHSRRPLRVND